MPHHWRGFGTSQTSSYVNAEMCMWHVFHFRLSLLEGIKIYRISRCFASKWSSQPGSYQNILSGYSAGVSIRCSYRREVDLDVPFWNNRAKFDKFSDLWKALLQTWAWVWLNFPNWKLKTSWNDFPNIILFERRHVPLQQPLIDFTTQAASPGNESFQLVTHAFSRNRFVSTHEWCEFCKESASAVRNPPNRSVKDSACVV